MLREIGIAEQQRSGEEKRKDALIASLTEKLNEEKETLTKLVAQRDALQIEKEVLLSANEQLNKSYLEIRICITMLFNIPLTSIRTINELTVLFNRV